MQNLFFLICTCATGYTLFSGYNEKICKENFTELVSISLKKILACEVGKNVTTDILNLDLGLNNVN